ncbi:DUF2087 domain-containing protein [Paenibacillus sp. XY044]|uniref:DUF2087 domain-containing protein n=1 Tax=Paenibacillus sp. XY044 TaxID=2026089 RepID=UPI00211B54E6|nr:DUF2087 domain-containing protein [Paenibacillus sp. XY044]
MSQANEMRNDASNTANEAMKAAVLRNFFAADGRLVQIPAQYKKKLIAMQHLVEKLEPGCRYAEKEINSFIHQFHEDYATIRREFIIHRYMSRDNDIYEMNPRDQWTKWENV